MEHLSRRTTQQIDLLLIVSEPNPIGILTAARIRDLAKELKINVKQVGLIINRVNGLRQEVLDREVAKYGLELVATIPADDTVVEYSFDRKPAIELPDDAPIVKAVDEMLKRYIA
jgi:CO dehydrogenase maturation factor